MSHRCLMISLEKGLFEPANPARKRIAEYGAFVEQLDIIVLATVPYDADIAPNVHVTSTYSTSRWSYLFDALHLVWKQRKEKKYDVIVSQDLQEMGLIAYIAAKFHNAAFAPQEHGYIFDGTYFSHESAANKLRALLARYLVQKADAIRVVSLRTERTLLQLFPKLQNKIIRFPLSIQPSFFDPHTSPLSAEEMSALRNRPYFLVPARFVPIKRIDLALQAFALFAKKHPDVLLVLLGKGPLLADIERQIAQLQLEEHTIIRPWTHTIVTWYKQALATVITSDREGYGLTALESLVSGTPVIMTDVGCAGETVIDEKNGYIVPVGDVRALAKAMEKIIQKTGTVQLGASTFEIPSCPHNLQDFIALAVSRKRSENLPNA